MLPEVANQALDVAFHPTFPKKGHLRVDLALQLIVIPSPSTVEVTLPPAAAAAARAPRRSPMGRTELLLLNDDTLAVCGRHLFVESSSRVESHHSPLTTCAITSALRPLTMNHLSSTCSVALSSLLLVFAAVHVAGAVSSSRPARHVGGLLPAFQLSRLVGATTGPGKSGTCLTAAAADGSEGASAVPQKFAIIGHNIAYSVSPAMHNAAYNELGLPHTYGLIDEEDMATIVASNFWIDPAFRGMSVTIPHKQAIMPHLDELSDAAERIGAVNTVIVDKAASGTIQRRGDNTDCPPSGG